MLRELLNPPYVMRSGEEYDWDPPKWYLHQNPKPKTLNPES